MRLKGVLFVELLIGIGTVMLIIAAVFYFASSSARTAEETAVRETEFEKRYEALRGEIEELEGNMVVSEDKASGRRWITREEPDGEYEMCGFSAGIWKKSDDVSLHTTIRFVHSDDISINHVFLLAGGKEYEIFLGNAKREADMIDEGNVVERFELPEDDAFQQLREAAKSEKIAVRFQGGSEMFYAQLTETQTQNLKSILRLFELQCEAWALGELRGMR